MAILNSYNYSKPKNYVNVNIGQKTNPTPPTNSVASVNKETDQYLEQRVMAAKPEELTYMLYEGVVRFIKKAMLALEQRDIVKIHNNTVKAQNIVTELRATLNMEVEMSEGLDSLYEYMEYKLFQANVEKDKKLFEEALEVAEELKETWRTAFNLAL